MKKLLSLALIILMLFSTVSINVSAETYSPKEKITYGGHTYYLYTDKLTWTEARDYCENIGGYLATFTSEDEWKTIHEQIKSNGTQCWFGGYGNGSIDTWKWITGEKWLYSDWCSGEPNNDYSGTENYLGTWTGSYQWNDYRQTEKLGFICEFGDLETLPILYESGWAIANSSPCFEYDSKYCIDTDLYFEVYGTAGALVEAAVNGANNTFNKVILNRGTWGGNCFGMSLSSVMLDNNQFNLDNKFSRSNKSDFFCDYSYDIVNSDKSLLVLQSRNIRNIIEKCQISQDSWALNDASIKIKDILSFFKDNDKSLVFASERMGHAIVINGHVEPVALGDGWYEFEVYDPNFPITNEVSKLDNAAWFYNQEISRNRRIQINPSTEEWYYYTYQGKDKYVYFKDSMFCTDKLYDTTKLSNKFLSEKLQVTAKNKQKVYIYPNTNKLAIYDKYKNPMFIYEKNLKLLNENIEYFPLSYGEDRENAPIGYIVLDSQEIEIVSENSKYSVIGNDNYSFVQTDSECSAIIDIDNSKTALSTNDGTNANIVIGMANQQEYSLIELDGKINKGENISATINKDNTLSISGNTTNDFNILAKNTNHTEVEDKLITSETMRNIITVDELFDGSKTTSFGSEVSDWAKAEVEEAYENNLIPDTIIGEDLTTKIDRAEFAAIAVQLYEELTQKNVVAKSNPFNDISGNRNLQYINKAYTLGITSGTSQTTFEPNLDITREQLATMLCRAIKKYSDEDWTLENDDLYYLDTSGVVKYEDDADISDYAKPSVYYMTKFGIIKGIDSTHFAPKNTTTKQEAQGYATATREQAIAISLRIFKISDVWK